MKTYEPLVVNDCPIKNEKKVQNNLNDNKESIDKEKVKISQKVLKKDSNYLGLLDIPKINLRRSLYKIGSYQNNVDRNVEVLKGSNMPDKLNGNFILAGHNGNTKVGYFKNLHKLIIGDKVIVNYKGKVYTYDVTKIYDVPKTGTVAIRREKNKTAITLITCLGIDRQLVIIGYLK